MRRQPLQLKLELIREGTKHQHDELKFPNKEQEKAIICEDEYSCKKSYKAKGRHSHASAIVGKYLYVYSGFETKRRTAKGSLMGVIKEPLLAYDLSTNKWQEDHQMPEKKQNRSRTRRVSHSRQTGMLDIGEIDFENSHEGPSNMRIPFGRSGATLTYDGGDGLYLLGGHDPTTGMAVPDMWKYNLSTKKWTQVCHSCKPCARSYHTTTLVGRKLVIAGGETAGGKKSPLVDMYDLDSRQWMTIAALPIAIAGHIATIYNQYLIIHGGEDDQGIRQSHVLAVTLTTPNTLELPIAKVLQTQHTPRPVAYHAATRLSKQHWLIHGGYPLRDNFVYIFDIAACDFYNVECQDSTRLFHHCLHTSSLSPNQVVMFGGKDFRKSSDRLAIYELRIRSMTDGQQKCRGCESTASCHEHHSSTCFA